MMSTSDEKSTRLVFGRYVSHWFHQTPRRLLHNLSYYKFAARLIGNSKRVLDIGCNEGLGTHLLAKECGFARGLDFDTEALEVAKNNFSGPNIEFIEENLLEQSGSACFDAVVNFDVIEHIYPEKVPLFWTSILQSLTPEGICILGTPSEISQTFASKVSKEGHVNVYSFERLEQTMRTYFEHVFLFAANDEVVHTGFLPLAHYFIAIGCEKKEI